MANEPNEDYMDKYFADAGVAVDETPNGASTESGTANDTTAGKEDDIFKEAVGEDSVSSASDGGDKSKPEDKKPVVDPTKAELPVGALRLADGTIVAPGAERRHYENMQLARQREQLAKNELNTANQNYTNLKTKYEQLEGSLKQLSLESPEDVTTAISLYKGLQVDTVGTLTKLLAEAKAKGYTIEGLGAQVDTAAITTLLDRKLEPSAIEKQHQQQQQQAVELENELKQFVTDFPDALTHEAYIAAVIDEEFKNTGKALSLRDAMFALKEKVVDQGLDWGQPLGPQIEARKAQNAPAPRPNGRLPDNTANPIDPGKTFAPENDSSDAIVRAAMRESGYKV